MIPYALFNSKIVFEPFQYKPYFEFFEHTDRDLCNMQERMVAVMTKH